MEIQDVLEAAGFEGHYTIELENRTELPLVHTNRTSTLGTIRSEKNHPERNNQSPAPTVFLTEERTDVYAERTDVQVELPIRAGGITEYYRVAVLSQ